MKEIDYARWNREMKNDDGSIGGHWTLDQTNVVAKELGCYHDEHDWNVTMNMMYSDYSKVADKFGVNVPVFFGMMADAFLKDVDSKKNKLKIYYNYIAEQ